jgi:3,4-dihydroxy 2-butanone 4-phosphate synthase/GTP cyclohydrolase II
MVNDNRSPMGTAFTVSIEAATGVTTGISAADRARTVRAATAKHAKPEDIVQPGHIFPVMAQNGGVLVRAGHTEAGCDLAELAGLTPAAVICEIMNPDGSMARMPELVAVRRAPRPQVGTIADLIRHRSRTRSWWSAWSTPDHDALRAVPPVRLPRQDGDEVHYALVKGEPLPDAPMLVRVHEPFVSLDLFDFDAAATPIRCRTRCASVAHHKEGVIVLLRRPTRTAEILERVEAARASARRRKWDPRTARHRRADPARPRRGKMRVLARPKRIPSMSGFGLEIGSTSRPTTPS